MLLPGKGRGQAQIAILFHRGFAIAQARSIRVRPRERHIEVPHTGSLVAAQLCAWEATRQAGVVLAVYGCYASTRKRTCAV